MDFTIIENTEHSLKITSSLSDSVIEVPAVLLWYGDVSGPGFNQETGQRLQQVSEWDPSMAIDSFEQDEDVVRVTWSNDYVSQHSKPWLERALLKGRSYLPSPIKWNPEVLDKNRLTVAFDDFLRDDNALKKSLQCFFEYGFFLIQGAQDSNKDSDKVLKEVLSRCSAFIRETNYGETFDVIVEKKLSHLAYSSVALSPHTDNNYREANPSVQLLQCIENEATGGFSILTDGFYVADLLKKESPEAYEILTQVPVGFEYEGLEASLYAETPILELKNKKLTAVHLNERTMSPLPVDSLEGEKFFKAFRRFCRLAYETSYQHSFAWTPGDVLIFDNHRILHGRTAYEELQGRRWLRGCYSDRDGFQSRYRQIK